MAKFYGAVGYAVNEEVEPGVYDNTISRKLYHGELTRNSSKFRTSDKIVNDVDISNEISIVADPYAIENFHTIRYVEFMGVKWNVISVEVKYPRLILTVGGVYNGA